MVWGEYTVNVKLEGLSLRQVGVAIPLFALLVWALSQFVLLPGMPDSERRRIYPGPSSNPYMWLLSVIFIIFAFWFVFRYQGRFSTQTARVVVFAMALGSLCGMLMVLAVRTMWRI